MARSIAVVVAALAANPLISSPAAAEEDCVPLVTSLPTYHLVHAHAPIKHKVGVHRHHRVSPVRGIATQRRRSARPHMPIRAAVSIARKPAAPIEHARVVMFCTKRPLASTPAAAIAHAAEPLQPNEGVRPPGFALNDLFPGEDLADGATADIGGEAGGADIEGLILSGGVTDDYGGGNAGNPTGPVIPPPAHAVPEPATWAMMLVGFFGLGAAMRSRRRRAAATA